MTSETLILINFGLEWIWNTGFKKLLMKLFKDDDSQNSKSTTSSFGPEQRFPYWLCEAKVKTQFLFHNTGKFRQLQVKVAPLFFWLESKYLLYSKTSLLYLYTWYNKKFSTNIRFFNITRAGTLFTANSSLISKNLNIELPWSKI